MSTHNSLKDTWSNGSVKTPKRRKSNGFGSQSMATKTELIEVQQKLEDSELRIANLEAELEEKLIESTSLNQQLTKLKIQLEEMEDKIEDKMEEYSAKKNKVLVDYVASKEYTWKQKDNQFENTMKDSLQDKKELLYLRNKYEQFANIIELLNERLKSNVPSASKITDLQLEVEHARNLFADEKSKARVKEVAHSLAETFYQPAIPKDAGDFVKYILGDNNDIKYDLMPFLIDLVSKARKKDIDERDPALLLVCEIIHRLINNRFVGKVSHTLGLSLYGLLRSKVLIESLAAAGIPCGSYTEVRTSTSKIVEVHQKPFRVAGAVWVTNDNTQKGTKPYTHSWNKNVSNKIVNQRWLDWRPEITQQQNVNDPYKTIPIQDPKVILAANETDLMRSTKSKILEDHLFLETGNKLDFIETVIERLFPVILTFGTNMDASELRDKIVNLVKNDKQIIDRMSAKFLANPGDKRTAHLEQAGTMDYSKAKQKPIEERLPKVNSRIMPVIDVNPGSLEGIKSVLREEYKLHKTDIYGKQRFWIPFVTDGGPGVMIIRTCRVCEQNSRK